MCVYIYTHSFANSSWGPIGINLGQLGARLAQVPSPARRDHKKKKKKTEKHRFVVFFVF